MDFPEVSTEPTFFDSTDSGLLTDGSSSDYLTKNTATDPFIAAIELTETSNMNLSH